MKMTKRTLLEKVEKLQAAFIVVATSSAIGYDTHTFSRLRQSLLTEASIKERVPDIVRKNRDPAQLWQFIKIKFGSYHERREYIREKFKPLIDYLEFQEKTPGVAPISETLEAFDPENVHGAWQKALDRRVTDPEGAITAARMLLETVCKHILDEAGGNLRRRL